MESPTARNFTKLTMWYNSRLGASNKAKSVVPYLCLPLPCKLRFLGLFPHLKKFIKIGCATIGFKEFKEFKEFKGLVVNG